MRVFSRNLEDVTDRYPDITSTFQNHLRPGARSVVLDAECCAFDRDAGKILPFQVLSTRGRKAVAAEDVKVQVTTYAYIYIYTIFNIRTLFRVVFRVIILGFHHLGGFSPVLVISRSIEY